MPEEIEAKVRIESPEDFRRRVEACGGEPRGTVLEVNLLFDDPAGTLRRRGAALRLRRELDPDGRRTLRATVTYKGPQAAGPLKRREELETAVESAETAAAILGAIGLVETFRFEKRRAAWRLGPCAVTLDEVPHLGHFAEVEGPSEGAVRKALRDLGLGGRPLIRQSYIALLAAHLEAAGIDPSRAVFADE